MTSRFSDWFNKITGTIPTPTENKPVSVVTEEPILPHERVVENIKKSDYDAYTEYAQLKRKLHTQKAYKQIHDYDSKNLEKNPNYKSMDHYIQNEVDDVDKDDNIDKALDIEQQKKLGVFSEVEDVSDSRKKQLEEQHKKYLESCNERKKLIDSMRQKLTAYDAKYKDNDQYKSYADLCKENAELNDDDEEMDRALMEKLGVYNYSEETDAVKRKRADRQAAIDKLIKKDKSTKRNSATDVVNQMSTYHELNKGRNTYHQFDCECNFCVDDNKTVLFKPEL